MDKNARFVGITSACGGVGTTSLALTLGRSLSRLNEKKVLYVSFDILGFKCGVVSDCSNVQCYRSYSDSVLKSNNEVNDICCADEYGLNFLLPASGMNPFFISIEQADAFLKSACGNFDVVILDVPSGNSRGIISLSLCEDIIVNYGLAEGRRRDICDEYLKLLKILFPDSRFTDFAAGFDEVSFESDPVDIHGEFGSEVRALAERIGL